MNPHIRTLQSGLGLRPDGLRGPVTTAAILEAADDGRLALRPAVPVPTVAPPTAPAVPRAHPVFASPRRADIVQVFGEAAGPDCTAGRCQLPLPFQLAWDQTQEVRSFACHILLAEVLTSIFAEALRHYGAPQFDALDLDQFGGCFAHRKKRGGTSLSIHSWGAAVDIDPARNQLKWGRDRATLARPDYDAWWRIVEAHGAFSLGRVKNYDWMHFQFVQV